MSVTLLRLGTRLRVASSESFLIRHSLIQLTIFQRVGDRVGVGAQSSSCLKPDCEECANGVENHCQNIGKANTYDDRYPDGSKSYGGYADYWRGPSHFVFKIPEQISSEDAAPMLCGGITLYSPLKRNGCGPGKKVGIIGIGGLGHFGILYAKALGADKIVAISRKANKKDDALKASVVAFCSWGAGTDSLWAISLEPTNTFPRTKIPSGPNIMLSRWTSSSRPSPRPTCRWNSTCSFCECTEPSSKSEPLRTGCLPSTLLH